MIEPAHAPYADQCSSADDVGNTQAGTSISNIVTSTSPGAHVCRAGRDMTYHVKARTFGEPVRWILGEYSALPLNSNSSFATAPARGRRSAARTLSVSTDYAYQGTQSMLITPPVVPETEIGGVGAGNYSTPGLGIPGRDVPGFPGPEGTITVSVGATSGINTTPATPGFMYTASAWLMIPYGWAAQVNLGWWDGSGNNLGFEYSSAEVTVAPGVWTQVDGVRGRARRDAWTPRCRSFSPARPSLAILCYVDQAMINEGAQPGGEIPYQGSIAYDYDPTRVVNSIQVTQLDRQDVVTPQVPALEQASARQYGTYTDYLTGYLFNDVTTPIQGADPSSCVDLANWLAETNAKPLLRVNEVTVDAASNPSAWPMVLGVSPGDVIIINRRPPTAANLVITQLLRVTQVARNSSSPRPTSRPPSPSP